MVHWLKNFLKKLGGFLDTRQNASTFGGFLKLGSQRWPLNTKELERYFPASKKPWIVIPRSETLHIKINQYDWGDLLAEVAVARGIPRSLLFKGSTKVQFWWDPKHNFYIREKDDALVDD